MRNIIKSNQGARGIPKAGKSLQLQGLRAIGCFLIISSHSGFIGNGGMGNVIFFVMAGFLFVKPFSSKDYAFNSWRELLVYYLKKFVTLYLPFATVVVLSRILLWNYSSIAPTWERFWWNISLYNCFMHLWFFQQIIIIYAIVPILIFLHMLLRKITKWKYLDLLYGLFLIGLAALSYYFLKEKVFHLYMNNLPTKFKPEVFLVGMAFGYFYTLISHRKIVLSNKAQHIVSIIPFILLVMCFAINYIVRALIIKNPPTIGWNYMLLTSIVIGVLVFTLSMVPNSWLGKILSIKPLVLIGDVSFVMYLIHARFLNHFPTNEKWLKALLVYFVCFALAVMLQKCVFNPINDFANNKIYTPILNKK